MSVPLFDALPDVADRLGPATHLFVGTDFDGTLVPFADDRSAVRLPANVRVALKQLANSPHVTLAVFSGRSVEDMAERVGLRSAILAGNHGLELRGPNWTYIDSEVEGARAAVAQLAANLARPLESIAGTSIEDKGLSVAVHFRQVASENHEAVRSAVHNVLASSSHPFVLNLGPLVFDIRPRVYWDKAAAVHRIRSEVGHPEAAIVYIAADATAEEVFAAFPEGITVRVGGPESSARYAVDGPTDVAKFLTWLGQHRGSPS